MSPPDNNLLAITDEQVGDYLQQHPDFFHRFESLLSQLDIPHGPTGATSLVSAQIKKLRVENHKLTKQLREFIQLAQENEALTKRIQGLLISLLQVSDEMILTNLRVGLKEQFNLAEVGICLFVPKIVLPQFNAMAELIAYDNKAYTLLEPMIKQDAVLMDGPLSEAVQQMLFSNDEQFSSVVFLPLIGDNWSGLIVLGSHEENRFRADKNIDMLTQFIEWLQAILAKWLEPKIMASI